MKTDQIQVYTLMTDFFDSYYEFIHFDADESSFKENTNDGKDLIALFNDLSEINTELSKHERSLGITITNGAPEQTDTVDIFKISLHSPIGYKSYFLEYDKDRVNTTDNLFWSNIIINGDFRFNNNSFDVRNMFSYDAKEFMIMYSEWLVKQCEGIENYDIIKSIHETCIMTNMEDNSDTFMINYIHSLENILKQNEEKAMKDFKRRHNTTEEDNKNGN